MKRGGGRGGRGGGGGRGVRKRLTCMYMKKGMCTLGTYIRGHWQVKLGPGIILASFVCGTMYDLGIRMWTVLCMRVDVCAGGKKWAPRTTLGSLGQLWAP